MDTTPSMESKSYPESERKGHKRKLADTFVRFGGVDESNNALAVGIRDQVEVLRTCVSWKENDRIAARRAAHGLAELAKHEEHVDAIVDEGAVDALVSHLCPPSLGEGEGPVFCEYEVEKDAAFALGLLAVKPEYQRRIADAGALPLLVALLLRQGGSNNGRVANGVVRRAADAITNLAHENAHIKTRVRTEGGIPPLVRLLESNDAKVQRAAAGALRTLAFKNEANKNQGGCELSRRTVTGFVKKTILKSQKLQASTGAERARKRKDMKKVTFELPDRVKDEPSENKLFGEETESTDLEYVTWATDKLRPGLVYGMYTAEEDGVLKQAIFDYIQEQGWDREEGLEKILNSQRSEAKGCWHVIRKCLPQRELKRLYSRAHRILGHGTLLGKWTNEEEEALTELYSQHGKDWKRIGTIIGRDPEACRHKWRQLKFTNSKDYKRGPWSEEEQQKLCKLVLKCLHVKAQMAKKELISKTHRLLRDDINWEFIAEQMEGRARLDCLTQWYRRMASPMVTTGEWSNGDDQRLLERLMEEFPLSEELVDWGSLLKNRSGETCKKRWEQMQRTLGRGPEVRHLHFLEKLESIMKRYAPHILDTEYDQKFAEDMLRADGDELEDEDM